MYIWKPNSRALKSGLSLLFLFLFWTGAQRACAVTDVYFSWDANSEISDLSVDIDTECSIYVYVALEEDGDISGFDCVLVFSEGIEILGVREMSGQSASVSYGAENRTVTWFLQDCKRVEQSGVLFAIDVMLRPNEFNESGIAGVVPIGENFEPSAYVGHVWTNCTIWLYNVPARGVLVRSTVVPNERSSFGSVKALFR